MNGAETITRVMESFFYTKLIFGISLKTKKGKSSQVGSKEDDTNISHFWLENWFIDRFLRFKTQKNQVQFFSFCQTKQKIYYSEFHLQLFKTLDS